MSQKIDRTQIIVAVIGLIGIITGAIIGNWGDLFNFEDKVSNSSKDSPIHSEPPGNAPTDPSLQSLKRQITDLEKAGLEALRENRLAEADIALQRAESLLEDALDRSPNNTTLLNLKGYLHKNWAIQYQRLSMKNQFEEHLNDAERTFKLTLSIERKDPGALNGLGSVNILRGNLDLAEDYVRRALDILPDYKAAQHDLKLIERLKEK